MTKQSPPNSPDVQRAIAAYHLLEKVKELLREERAGSDPNESQGGEKLSHHPEDFCEYPRWENTSELLQIQNYLRAAEGDDLLQVIKNIVQQRDCLQLQLDAVRQDEEQLRTNSEYLKQQLNKIGEICGVIHPNPAESTTMMAMIVESTLATIKHERDSAESALQNLAVRARAVGVTFCAIRCGFHDHTPECRGLKEALEKRKDESPACPICSSVEHKPYSCL